MQMFSLEGQVALVTGASRGLGKAIAGAFAEAGARVILAARDGHKLADVSKSIRDQGGQAEIEVFDLADEDAVVAAIGRINQRHGVPHILVNNAAAMPRMPFLDSSLADWDEAQRTNLRAPYLLCREVARGMIERNQGGRIINITSYAGLVGRDNIQAYAASKAGLAGLTRSLACELGPHGITVNNISPGLFMTDLSVSLRTTPVVMDKYRGLIALARPGEPHEIAGAALFLASSAGSYVTGTTIDVDGGIANTMPVRYDGPDPRRHLFPKKT